MKALTYRQFEVHAFICEHIRQHGYAPSMREIGAHFGIGSTNGVADHLTALRRKGVLAEPGPQKSRALVPLTDEHGNPWRQGFGAARNFAPCGEWPASLTTMSGLLLRRVDDVDLRCAEEREADQRRVDALRVTIREQLQSLPQAERVRLLKEASV